MRMTGLARTAGSSALLLCLLASASPAQDRSRQRAPIVRVYSQDATGVVSNYVRPLIRVSEDAYVFAVMMDLDGHIQVLHPDFPGISVRIRSDKQLTLPNFFAGFNDPQQRSRYSGLASYNNGYQGSENDTRGTVIAIASRAPLNLELIEAGGDWDNSAIRELIEHRSPESAARALAKYLGAKGEPIGHDYMRFAGHRQSYYAYNGYNDLAYCGYNQYAYSLFGGYYGIHGLGSATALRAAGLRPLFLGYDACGLPIIVVSPFTRGGRFRLPQPARPPGDTTVFPKSRFPNGAPRHPIGGDNTPQGIFPLTRRADLPQARDVTITAPQGRRAEPREILEQFRPQPGAVSRPDRGRLPVERAVPRAEPAASGMRPVYRPEPRVAAPAEPARMPERIREAPPVRAPAPVVHERPQQSSPPPPPSRAHVEPQSRPDPAPVPPPRG
jgi:hypothetical protein